MADDEHYDDYVKVLREEVCSRCIERAPGGPPCAPRGKTCGIEAHVPKLVEICRSTDSVLMDPYIERLHDQVCTDCAFKDEPTCPCPLEYLLQLAVEAVESVERQRVEGRPGSGIASPEPTVAASETSCVFGYEI